jgi:hypothetical protein
MVTTKQYTFSNVAANHTISAEFEIMTFQVRIVGVSSAEGILSYKVGSDNWETVPADATATLQLVPYGTVIQVKVEGTQPGKVFNKFDRYDELSQLIDSDNNNPASFTIEEACIISAVFNTVTTYTITASAGSNGTISPSGTIAVNSGDSKTFTVTADAHYVIKQILVDGSPIQL